MSYSFVSSAGSFDSLKNSKYIEMSSAQSCFLVNLIRSYQPQKILELGVAAGGSSCLILDTLQQMGSSARLHSVDLSERYYLNPQKQTGFLIQETLDKGLAAQCQLYLGHSVAHFLPEIDVGIDFCILDASHFMPGELLDFIAILPFLKDGAIVVLHDLTLSYEPAVAQAIATRVLFSTVCADKFLPEQCLDDLILRNIGAFRVNADTRDNIFNCFLALELPWNHDSEIFNDELHILDDFRGLLAQYYPTEMLKYFEQIGLDKRATRQKCISARPFWFRWLRAVSPYFLVRAMQLRKHS